MPIGVFVHRNLLFIVLVTGLFFSGSLVYAADKTNSPGPKITISSGSQKNSANGTMTIVVRDDKDCLIKDALVCVRKAPNMYYLGPGSPQDNYISTTNTVRQVQELHDYFHDRQNRKRRVPGSPWFPSPDAFQFTDDKGNARFNMPEGKYNVTITKPGYYGSYYPKDAEPARYVNALIEPGVNTTNATIITKIPKEAFEMPGQGAPKSKNSIIVHPNAN